MKTIRLIAVLAFVLSKTVINIDAQNINNKVSNDYLKLQPNEKNSKLKADIGKILEDKIEIYNKKDQVIGTPEVILVLDDRIEFKIKKQNTIFYYSDFIDISLPKPIHKKGKIIFEFEDFIYSTPGRISTPRQVEDMNRLLDLRYYFILIQHQFYKQRNAYQNASKLIAFEPIAAQYRALKEKPSVSEEQRKYIVQANLFNDNKQYDKAIELYLKAIETDQTSYPTAYSNLALLSAQIKNFDNAIFFMKCYLLLEPEASDARSTQDKIYEWEANINQ